MVRGRDEHPKPLNLHDYESLARDLVHPAAWAYYSGGADDEVTLRAERDAFSPACCAVWNARRPPPQRLAPP